MLTDGSDVIPKYPLTEVSRHATDNQGVNFYGAFIIFEPYSKGGLCVSERVDNHVII